MLKIGSFFTSPPATITFKPNQRTQIPTVVPEDRQTENFASEVRLSIKTFPPLQEKTESEIRTYQVVNDRLDFYFLVWYDFCSYLGLLPHFTVEKTLRQY